MDNIQATRSQRWLDGADEVRRLDGFKSYNLVAVLLIFVELISEKLASFADKGRHLIDSFLQWIQMSLESFVRHGQAPICKWRVLSRDLKSVQFLGQGFSGFIYETTWSTWHGKEKLGRFARKDFPGVESKVFENEAARLVNLNHPNVVEAFCWTVDRLGCSLVLEFVNTDLQSVVEKREEAHRKVSASKDPLRSSKSVNGPASPFELIEAIHIMLHIARAMEYLHSEGVAHGDLRPNNVLVDLEADPKIVKLVDFGLIESKKRATLVSKRARFLRTLEWKAPETCEVFLAPLNESSDEYPWAEMDTVQAEGRVNAADQLADVYSFAITCTYILGVRVSYPKSSSTRLQKDISSGTLRPEIPSTCPKLLRDLIELSWDSNPEKRRSFSYLREQLEIIQQQETERERFFTPLMKPNKTQQFFTVLFHLPHQHRSVRVKFDANLQEGYTVIEEHWSSIEASKAASSILSESSEARFDTENLEVFGSLKKEWSHFFRDNLNTLVLGQPIAEGGQGAIFNASWEGVLPDGDRIILKVYDSPLIDLQNQFPNEFLRYADHAIEVGSGWNPRICHIFGGLLLEDGRFAFAMERYWGDLRKAIDSRLHNNLNQRPPFSITVAKRIMLEIAEGVRGLHDLDILHRDIKASNIFINPSGGVQGDTEAANVLGKSLDKDWNVLESDEFSCVVGDFECSVGVVGTGFWRAPEILLALKNHKISPLLCTTKTDVYSYSMTCYEILTGRIPFEGLRPRSDWDNVIDGARPELPVTIDPVVNTLLCRCWHSNPLRRPTFEEICEELSPPREKRREAISFKQSVRKKLKKWSSR